MFQRRALEDLGSEGCVAYGNLAEVRHALAAYRPVKGHCWMSNVAAALGVLDSTLIVSHHICIPDHGQ